MLHVVYVLNSCDAPCLPSTVLLEKVIIHSYELNFLSLPTLYQQTLMLFGIWTV